MNREQIESLINLLEEELDNLSEEEREYEFLDLGNDLCVEFVGEPRSNIFIGKEDNGYWYNKEQAIQIAKFINGKLGE